MPRPQSVKPTNWHLKPRNLSWISTVYRWNFWRTSDEIKRTDQCAVTELLVSSCFVFLFPRCSQFQSAWLWYRTTAQECFCFGSIVYPRRWGSNWRGCGDCWIGMRLRGRGAAGWQQDQKHRGQSSLKRPGWGWEPRGPQCLFYVAVCVCACLIESSRLLRVNAYNNEGTCFWQHMSHLFTHIERALGSRGEGTTQLFSTLQQCCSLMTILYKSVGAHSVMRNMRAATKANVR